VFHACVQIFNVEIQSFWVGPVRLSYKSYFFCQPIIFFSHNKSANSIFSHDFLDQLFSVMIFQTSKQTYDDVEIGQKNHSIF